jgi:hypothetical protein
MSIPLTYKMLASAAPVGVTPDTVTSTDLMLTDGEATGAIAKLMEGNNVLYVWPNGRIWVRSGACSSTISTWLVLLQTSRGNPHTNSGGASAIPVV